MSDAKKEFAKRLCDAMERAGYEAKPAVLEREFNLKYLGSPMTLHGVRRWLRGETLPPPDKIDVLANWLDVDPQLLRFGHKAAKVVREKTPVWNETVPAHEKEIVEAFLALPAPQKKIVREVIQAFAKAYAQRR